MSLSDAVGFHGFRLIMSQVIQIQKKQSSGSQLQGNGPEDVTSIHGVFRGINYSSQSTQKCIVSNLARLRSSAYIDEWEPPRRVHF